MKRLTWPNFDQWPRLLTIQAPEQEQQAIRLRYMELFIGLPVRAMVVALLFYYFFFSGWYEEMTSALDMEQGDVAQEVQPVRVPSPAPADGLEGELNQEIMAVKPLQPGVLMLEGTRYFFLVYVVINVAVALLLFGMSEIPLKWLQHVFFHVAWVDVAFVSLLLIVTGGYDSILYWVYLGLILRNAISTSIAERQILLNAITTLFYLVAGIVEAALNERGMKNLHPTIRAAIEFGPQETGTEPFLIRFLLLLVVTLCCFGVQALFDKQRRSDAEASEYAVRRAQLLSAGRLAAEIAHQLKNPLGIINNASFTLQRTVKEGKAITQHLQIIREEVERSDRIITELMGYARLSDGSVEKIDVTEALDRAIEQVFPRGTDYPIQIERDYAPALPNLLMQRGHISEVFVNLLQNAREALDRGGIIRVSAHYGEDYSVVVRIADNGPGIPADKLAKIFEPYYTTKPKGTGLGLAIVRHNTEMYDGTVAIESEPGKGTAFTIRLPAKSVIKIRK